MPFNATNAERQATANRELAAKIRLEPPMVRELRSMFAQISRDLGAFYALTGQVPDAQLYAPELTGILTRQYRRVDQEFSDNIIGFLRDADEDDPTVIILTAFAAENGMTFDELLTNMENDITLREQNFIAANVRQDAINITSTTQKDLDVSIIFGTLFLIDQGIANPTRSEVAREARKSFKKSSRSRPSVIAATVTQKAAEGIKQIGNDVFFANRNRGIIAPLEQEEFWITRGDERVRQAHVDADDQKKNTSGVFIVGGEQLKFPGDTSLGASAGNVIGCRCSAILSIDDSVTVKPGAERVTVEATPIDLDAPTAGTIRGTNAAPNIERMQTASPVKSIKKVSKSTTSTIATDQKLNRRDVAPKMPDVKLSGDESAYVEYYKGSGFYKQNEILRNPSAFSSSEVTSARKMKNSLNSAVKKSTFKTDGTLYRGIRSQQVFDNAESLIGKDIRILTPQSTSTTAGSATGWAGLTRTSKGDFLSANRGQSVVFKIRTKKGQHGLNMESLSIGNTAENEVLLAAGGKYRVTGVRNLTDSSGNVSGKVIEVDFNE